MTEEKPFAELQSAIGWLKTERKYVNAELDAFRTLQDRVADFDPEEPRQPAEHPSSPSITGKPGESSPSQLDEVVAAFERTVMATPHYEAEYGDDVLQNFAIEFTPSLATLVTNDAAMTPPVYNQLTAELAKAIQVRTQLDTVLAVEKDSLSELQTKLESVQEHLDTLTSCSVWKWTTAALQLAVGELADDLETCERVAAARQRTLHDCRSDISRAAPDAEFEAYMYPDTTATYPGLAAISVVTDQTQDVRAQFQTELASRGATPPAHDDAERSTVQ